MLWKDISNIIMDCSHEEMLICCDTILPLLNEFDYLTRDTIYTNDVRARCYWYQERFAEMRQIAQQEKSLFIQGIIDYLYLDKKLGLIELRELRSNFYDASVISCEQLFPLYVVERLFDSSFSIESFQHVLSSISTCDYKDEDFYSHLNEFSIEDIMTRTLNYQGYRYSTD